MKTEKFYSVAIDGPAGAGKSTIAKLAAQELGFVYVDTGAIYRTVGYHMNLMGIGPKDRDGIERLLDDVNLEIIYDSEKLQHMILNGRDVTQEIRTPEMSRIASVISTHSVVRAFLLDIQRNLALTNHVIMDGRDIGTVVLPSADVKIYLTATTEIRAERRYRELLARGQSVKLPTILKEIELRDHQDMTRSVAPLRQAKDAVVVDTSEMNLEEATKEVIRIILKGISL